MRQTWKRLGIGVVLVWASLAGSAQATGTTAHPAPLVAATGPAGSNPGVALVMCGQARLEIVTGLPGGYFCAPTPYRGDVVAAAAALVAGADQALPLGRPRRTYGIASAATQVVAGRNYKLVVRVRQPRPETLIGTVYRALDGSTAVTNVYGLVG